VGVVRLSAVGVVLLVAGCGSGAQGASGPDAATPAPSTSSSPGGSPWPCPGRRRIGEAGEPVTTAGEPGLSVVALNMERGGTPACPTGRGGAAL